MSITTLNVLSKSQGVREAANMISDVDTSAFLPAKFLFFGLKNTPVTRCTFQSDCDKPSSD